MFKVVDVLCAVSYKVAEYDWIFPLCYGVFPVCHGLHRAVVRVIRGVTCRLPVFRRIIFLSIMDFLLSYTPGHLCKLCISPVCSE